MSCFSDDSVEPGGTQNHGVSLFPESNFTSDFEKKEIERWFLREKTRIYY